MFEIPEAAFQLIKYTKPGNEIFLVGGAIRDALLEKRSSDLDFVCKENTRDIARKFADEIGGNFYILDRERNIYRVLTLQAGNKQIIFDFAAMRGFSIEEDLLQRDFTINAMAINLSEPNRIIDPFKGGRDLQQKKLRWVKSTCLEDDPLRVIRAIRYSTMLKLRIDSELLKMIYPSVEKLKEVSVERIRDEFFKILDLENPGTGLDLLFHFGMLQFLGLSGSEEISTGIQLARAAAEIMGLFKHQKSESMKQSFSVTSLFLQLGSLKDFIFEFYFPMSVTGRNRRSILLLACLLENIPGEEAVKILQNLCLSNAEIQNLETLIREKKSAQNYIFEKNPFGDRDIYRYFLQPGDVGIDLVIRELAQSLSLPTSQVLQDDWLKILHRSYLLIRSWFERKEIIDPLPLLSGNDLMFLFDLVPGPLIGTLIEELKEEQAAGVIVDKPTAISWIDQRLLRVK